MTPNPMSDFVSAIEADPELYARFCELSQAYLKAKMAEGRVIHEFARKILPPVPPEHHVAREECGP